MEIEDEIRRERKIQEMSLLSETKLIKTLEKTLYLELAIFALIQGQQSCARTSRSFRRSFCLISSKIREKHLLGKIPEELGFQSDSNTAFYYKVSFQLGC